MKPVLITFKAHVDPDRDLDDVGANVARVLRDTFKQHLVMVNEDVHVEHAGAIESANGFREPDVASPADSSECPKCGSPIMIDAATGKPEKCANCASQSSRRGLFLGGLAVTLGLIGVVYLVYVCIKALLLSS